MRKQSSTLVPTKTVPFTGQQKCNCVVVVSWNAYYWLPCGKDSKLNNPLGRWPSRGTRRLLKWHVIITVERVADKELWMVMENAFRQHLVKCLPVMKRIKQLPVTDCSNIRPWITEGGKWTYKMPEFGTVNLLAPELFF